MAKKESSKLIKHLGVKGLYEDAKSINPAINPLEHYHPSEEIPADIAESVGGINWDRLARNAADVANRTLVNYGIGKIDYGKGSIPENIILGEEPIFDPKDLLSEEEIETSIRIVDPELHMALKLRNFLLAIDLLKRFQPDKESEPFPSDALLAYAYKAGELSAELKLNEKYGHSIDGKRKSSEQLVKINEDKKATPTEVKNLAAEWKKYWNPESKNRRRSKSDFLEWKVTNGQEKFQRSKKGEEKTDHEKRRERLRRIIDKNPSEFPKQ